MATDNGSIIRDGDKTIVQYGDKTKVFLKKPIYFGPDAFERAMDKHLRFNRGVVLAMNGYSSLTPEQCRAYRIEPGAYETACAAILMEAVKSLQRNFPGVQICLAHGAANMGVDKAVINVGQKLNLPQLGFNCPAYMPYVDDDSIPVYVAPSKEEYCDAFTTALDILITANGRKVTFEMDIDAVFKKHKDVVPINVMQAISPMGGPPATREDGTIEDAVAFWYLKMHHVSSQMGMSGVDSWESVQQSVGGILTKIVRRMMPPTVAFGYEWHREFKDC